MKIESLKPQKELNGFSSGDYLVLFGELFQKGYANGLVEAALARGMVVIRSTVGRRDESLNLRPLNTEELETQAPPFINVPLECSFDLEPSDLGPSPVDLCKSVGLKEALTAKLDFEVIKQSRENGRKRFRTQVQNWVEQVNKIILPGKKVFMAHLMAGGVPRSKVVLGIMNRVFKGTGDRHVASKVFWESDLGRLCDMSFNEVTAESFNILVEETSAFRKKIEGSGGSVFYSAYGYHGTPIYVDNEVQWLSYTPYLQGFAKRKLEEHATQFWNKGLKTTVYNCPEILTNSSGIFPGVEVFLYTLLFEIRRRNLSNSFLDSKLSEAESALKPNGLNRVQEIISLYLKNPLFRSSLQFETWPSHSNKELMETMLGVSDELVELHKSQSELMTFPLSEIVIKASGALMLEDLSQTSGPVRWIGHDSVIAFFERETQTHDARTQH